MGLSRIEDLREKTDHDLLILLVQGFNELNTSLGSHDKRITSVEVWRAYLAGAISVVGIVVVGIIIPLVLRALS